MRDLLLTLLNDPFGLASPILKTLLQIVEDEDEDGERIADVIESHITEIEVNVPGSYDDAGEPISVKRNVILVP